MAVSFVPIEITAGVQPSTDFTPLSTPHYTNADKVRFRDGIPEKIGGWAQITLDNGTIIDSSVRTIFSYSLSGVTRYILGGDRKLYYLLGSSLTNITPLDTSFTAIANSLDSNFGTLGADPLATTDGSATVTVTDAATRVRVGDTITLSGVPGAVNGIPAVELNTAHFVRTQDTNSYTFIVSTAATSTGSGGGGAVVQATPIITVNATAHGLSDGDRVVIQGAVAFAGIPAGEINAEHIIRNVDTNEFDIVVTTPATSSVSGGGGAGTEFADQIDAGLCDATATFGYGAGRYGVGLYGTSRTSTSAISPARSWVLDRFGDLVIVTPGEQLGLYSWDSSTITAPALVANAPTAINYAFVSDNIAVTLGASGVGNRLQWCDQGNLTTWTAASTNQAGQDDIEGASEFISHAPVKSVNLLFTASQVYTFRYIGRPFVWETRLLDDKSGIIGRNARVVHNGIAYWMGPDNFYFYRSGNVEIIPSNTTNETTLKRFVFDDINLGQSSKIFAWFNKAFNEVWFHYPSSGNLEPNRIARLNVRDFTWTPDTMDRSAGEYPTSLGQFPYLAESTESGGLCTAVIYEHEKGKDDDGSSLPFSLVSRLLPTGTDQGTVTEIIPDSIQTDDISVLLTAQEYPQSPLPLTSDTYTVSPSQEEIAMRQTGRYFQYTVSGDVLGQDWRGGVWQQAIEDGGSR